MKTKLLLALLSVVLLAACSSSRNFSSEEEKSFFSKLKKLEKDPGNTILRQEVIDLYTIAEQQHLYRVAALRSSSDLGRYDKLLRELEQNQKISNEIRQSVAYRYITPPDYYQQIALLKEEAAGAWYDAGIQYLGSASREDIKMAYKAFKKSGQFVSNFSNSRNKMKEAFELATVDIVIQPLRVDAYFFRGWSGRSNSDYLVNMLVNDLGGTTAGSVPARFYTREDAAYNGVRPDWIIEQVWKNLQIPEPEVSRHTYTVSKNIVIGTDTAGRPHYKTVSARVHRNKKTLRASGHLEYIITETDTRNREGGQRLFAQYNWDEEYATYDGDSRALGAEDWQLINRGSGRMPDRNDLMEELYRNIYQDLKNRIRNEADW